jgi:hypothetical protein
MQINDSINYIDGAAGKNGKKQYNDKKKTQQKHYVIYSGDKIFDE